MASAVERKILERLLSETIGSRESISYEEFRRSPLPAGLKGFMAASLTEALSGKIFNGESELSAGSGAAVRTALVATLLNEKIYPRAEFTNELRRSVQFLSGYVVTPQQALIQWMFGTGNADSAPALLKTLSFVTEYRYLPELLAEWLSGKGARNVTKDEAARVLHAIDRRVVARHSQRELVLLVHPLFEFASFGLQSSGLQAPAVDVQAFYREKRLDRFWQGLSSRLETGLPLVRFQDLLDPPAVVRTTTDQETGEPGAEVVPSTDVVQPDNAGVAIDPPAEPDRTAEELLPDLGVVITREQEDAFVRSLFEQDPAFYSAIISSLNRLPTWKEAAIYLSQFYQTNDLDPFADVVVEFTDAVHRRYIREGVS